MIGYVGTAGISIVIVAIYYLTAHRPECDPFRKDNGTVDFNRAVPFRPNPVDELILGLITDAKRWIYAKFGRKGTKRLPNSRLEEAFVKVRISSQFVLLDS